MTVFDSAFGDYYMGALKPSRDACKDSDFESLVANRAKRHRSREHCNFEPVRSSTSAQGRYFSKHHPRLVPFCAEATIRFQSSLLRSTRNTIRHPPFCSALFSFFGQPSRLLYHQQASLLGAASSLHLSATVAAPPARARTTAS